MLHILETAPPQGGNYTQIIFLVAIIAIFYFFMIRPQVKKQKQERKFREEIKKGDKVITSGGLHAKVVEVAEKTVKLDVGGSTILKYEKSGISSELSNKKD